MNTAMLYIGAYLIGLVVSAGIVAWMREVRRRDTEVAEGLVVVIWPITMPAIGAIWIAMTCIDLFRKK
jgi:hypothetical protein